MKPKIRIYSLSVFFLTVALTALRALSLFFSFDYEIGYFDNSLLPEFFRALNLASLLWCLSALIFIPKDTTTAQKSASPLSAGIAVACAVLIGISGLFLVLTNVKNGFGLPVACGSLLILGSAYPLCKLSTSAKPTLGICSGMLLVIALVLVMFIFHFDMYITINSPLKTSAFLSLVTGAVFLLCEMRFLFDDGMSRTFFVAKLLCVVLCLPTAVGNLILAFSSKMPLPARDILSPFLALPLLALALYAAFGALRTIAQEKENKEF